MNYSKFKLLQTIRHASNSLLRIKEYYKTEFLFSKDYYLYKKHIEKRKALLLKLTNKYKTI